MLLLRRNGIITLSNFLFHGIDFYNIIRMDKSLGETFFGVFISFLFWGIIGYLVAMNYNKIK